MEEPDWRCLSARRAASWSRARDGGTTSGETVEASDAVVSVGVCEGISSAENDRVVQLIKGEIKAEYKKIARRTKSSDMLVEEACLR